MNLDALLDALADRLAERVAVRLAVGGAVDLLDVGQAAELARCAPRRVADAARSGTLPSSRRGRSRVFRRSDVLAWVSAAPCALAADADIDRRAARLARARKP